MNISLESGFVEKLRVRKLSYSFFPNSSMMYVFPICLAPETTIPFLPGSAFHLRSVSIILRFIRMYENPDI